MRTGVEELPHPAIRTSKIAGAKAEAQAFVGKMLNTLAPDTVHGLQVLCGKRWNN